MRRVTLPQKKNCEYKFYTEFQSHEPEFDYLKSLEIEEKINKIKWCRRQNASHFLLSTNGELLFRLYADFHPHSSQIRRSSCGKCSKSQCGSSRSQTFTMHRIEAFRYRLWRPSCDYRV